MFLVQHCACRCRAGFASLGCQTSALNLKKLFNEIVLLPLRVSCNQKSARLAQHMRVPEQAQEDISPTKIDVTIKSPVGDISVVTLIRTDTTLDHSQKAEKVCVAQNFQNLFQTKKRKMYLGLVLLLKSPSKPMIKQTMWLAVARKQTTSKEILLWMTPSEAPKALQTSECSELLDPMRASCWISAQH